MRIIIHSINNICNSTMVTIVQNYAIPIDIIGYIEKIVLTHVSSEERL